jgi:hypothetical protein
MLRSGQRSSLNQEDAMFTKHAVLGAAVAALAALAASTPVVTGVLGSSQREAPRIMLDPAADNTDLYASHWIPLRNPVGGPHFGELDPSAA